MNKRRSCLLSLIRSWVRALLGRNEADKIRALLAQPDLLYDLVEEAVFNEHGNYTEDATRASHIATKTLIELVEARLNGA